MDNFLHASGLGSLDIRAKSQFFVGCCLDLRGNHGKALEWYEDSYQSACLWESGMRQKVEPKGLRFDADGAREWVFGTARALGDVALLGSGIGVPFLVMRLNRLSRRRDDDIYKLNNFYKYFLIDLVDLLRSRNTKLRDLPSRDTLSVPPSLNTNPSSTETRIINGMLSSWTPGAGR